jgi:hypothetical protein
MSAVYSIASDLSGKLLARIIGARQKTLRNTLSSLIGSLSRFTVSRTWLVVCKIHSVTRFVTSRTEKIDAAVGGALKVLGLVADQRLRVVERCGNLA